MIKKLLIWFIEILKEIFNENPDPTSDINREAKGKLVPLNQKDDIANQYFMRQSITTKTELIFYKQLKISLVKDEIIVIKPRVEDVIGAKNTKNKFSNRGKIKSRHFDFVVCDSELKPLCIIELDDKSHNTKKAQKIDKFKDDLCKSVNLRMLRIPVSTSYEIELLQALIYQLN